MQNSVFFKISQEIKRMRWLILGHVAIIGCLIISSIIIYKALTHPRNVLMYDKSHTYHFTKTQNTFENTSVILDCSKRATELFLNRTHNGFENIHHFKKLFIDSAHSTAMDIINQERSDFDEKKITQEIKIIQNYILEYREEQPIVNVKGYLYRTLEFKGKKFHKTYKFALPLFLKRNTDINDNNQYPFQVMALKYKIKLDG